MQKPWIKGYKNDEELQDDIKKMKDNGTAEDKIFVISHDVDRTERIIDNETASVIKVDGNFDKPGDEIRAQLKEVGFDDDEAESYEGEMDKGTVFLICTDPDFTENI